MSGNGHVTPANNPTNIDRNIYSSKYLFTADILIKLIPGVIASVKMLEYTGTVLTYLGGQ